MSRNKPKICLGCQRIFDARRDAKTCSSKCRKRYQRAREGYLATRPLSIQRSPVNFKYAEKEVGGKRYAA